jgi:cytochrome P450
MRAVANRRWRDRSAGTEASRPYGRAMTWPTIPPAPDTPACGPPLPVGDGWVVTRHADVLAVLTDPGHVVPAGPGGPPGTLAWLRGTVSRFSPPDRHPARRAIGVAALAGLDPDELRAAAARSTVALLDTVTAQRVEVMASHARRVPLEVLAARLGLADPAAAVPAVTAVAAAYHPGAAPAAVARADRAVAALLALSPPGPAEAAANRIGLLVQAADATAGLIGNAVRHGLAAPTTLGTSDLLAEMLRLDPPVRATRRVATAARRLAGRGITPDAVLLLRFDAANRDPAAHPDPEVFRPGRPGGTLTFGAGTRGCPGERHALALAAGVVEVLRDRCRPAPRAEPVSYDPHRTLRVPTSLEVMLR